MSIKYRDSQGHEFCVAPLNPGGDIEAGAMAERSGTFDISVGAGSFSSYAITFDEPMPDGDYIVSFYGPTSQQQMQYLFFNSDYQTANGFRAVVNNVYNATVSRTGIRYKAVKTYSVQHAAQNAEDIANILSVIPSNATSANKLATQSDLENVEIDVDDELDSTSENPVQNKVVKAAIDEKQDKMFVGTVAEWEELTAEEKAIYQLVNLTDDGETGSEENYSTSEVRTNKRWIDGKPIYRKCFSIPAGNIAPSANAANTLPVTYDLSNKTIINSFGFVRRSDGFLMQLGGYYSTLTINRPTFYLYTRDWNTNTTTLASLDFAIEYTKTTD